MTDSPYLAYLRDSAPPWLAQPYGRAWNEAFGLVWDIVVDSARKAVLARFVDTAPDDALPLVASERSLEAMPAEASVAWRARLKSAWDAWQWAGTKKGVIDALHLMGLTNITIHETSEWQAGHPAEWARFWTVIHQPHPFRGPIKCGVAMFTRRGRSMPTSGAGYLCGIGGATRDQVDRLRRLMRLWKPAHAFAEPIKVLLGGAIAGGGSVAGTGVRAGGASQAHITV